MKGLVWCVTALCLVQFASALNYTIHEPLQDGVEVAIVIVPGAYLSAGSYTPLARALQRKSPFRLWVGVAGDFQDGLANMGEIAPALDLTLHGLKEAGMRSDKVFAVGHSLGGAVLLKHLATQQGGIDGLVLWASIPRDATNEFYQSYPMPILRLSGDLDGISRISKLAESFDIAMPTASKLRSPICLLTGVNHAQFSSGPMPPNVALNDLRAEKREVDAHREITQVTTYFTVVTLDLPNSGVAKSKAELVKMVDDTMQRLFPLKVAKSLEQSGGKPLTSLWGVRAQEFVIGAPSSLKKQLKISNTVETNLTLFRQSKPTATMNSEGTVRLTTVTYVRRKKIGFGPATGGQSAESLDVKMKCQESVKRLHRDGNYGNELSCREINKHAFDWALSMSSQEARDRYSNRGKPMVFSPDFMAQNGKEWLQANLTLVETEEGTTEVTSTALVSDPDHPMKMFAGMHYCKLLSPYKAMEWIYIDSLRGKQYDASTRNFSRTSSNPLGTKKQEL